MSRPSSFWIVCALSLAVAGVSAAPAERGRRQKPKPKSGPKTETKADATQPKAKAAPRVSLPAGVRLLTAEEEKALRIREPKKAHEAAQADERRRLEQRRAFLEQNPEAKEQEGSATIKSGQPPSRFDWTDEGMVTPVKSQVGGTCWAFARAAVMESSYLLRHREKHDLYEQDLINCNCRKCDGSSPENHEAKVLAGLRLQGDKENKGDGAGDACISANCGPCNLQQETPYRLEYPLVAVDPIHTEDGLQPHEPPAVSAMKAALMAQGPLYVKMHIPEGSGFGSHSGAGVFKETVPILYASTSSVGSENSGAHLVNIVGWDDSKQAWRIKNSWGTGWGDGGFAWLAYGSNNVGMGAAWAQMHAPDQKVTAVWRKGDAKEIQVHGWAHGDYQNKYDNLWKDGYRLHLLETAVDGKEVLYSAVWRKGDDAEMQFYRLSYPEYQKKYDGLWKDGWRIKFLNTYVVDGQVRYDAVWRKGDRAETQYYGMSYAEFQKKYDELWKKGERIKILNQYVVGGKVRYDAVWVPGDQGEMQFYEMAFDAYKEKNDDLSKDGWRLHILNNFRRDGKVVYSAVWRKSEEAERKAYAWDYDSFRAKDDELRKDGWRLHILNAF
jgi:hypothetical protein